MFEPATTRALRIPVNPADAYSPTLAVEITEGQGPTFVWLCGYNSTMTSGKASWLKEQCEAWGYRCIRFNYRCMTDEPLETLVEKPEFQQQTITQHVEDTIAILNQLTDSPSIIIGSSMGGWVGMRLMQLVPEKIAGFVGIAAAPDFSTKYDETIERNGRDGHTPVFSAIVRDGKNNMVMKSPIAFDKPVALVQGMLDTAVEWKTALAIAENLTSRDITLHIIKDAEHRLSRPQDLDLLWQVVTNMREKVIANLSS